MWRWIEHCVSTRLRTLFNCFAIGYNYVSIWCLPLRVHLHVLGMLRYMSKINQPRLPTLFLFCSCVYFCLYCLFNCISVHTFSRQLSVFLLCSSGLISALLVLSTIYLCMKISLKFLCGTFYNLFNDWLGDKLKFVFSPDVILCGWLG